MKNSIAEHTTSFLRSVFFDRARLQVFAIVASILTLVTVAGVTLAVGDATDLPISLSLALAFLSLAIALASVYRPKSRVIYVPKSKSFFSSEVGEGITSVFSQRSDFELISRPAENVDGLTFDQQLEIIVQDYLFSPRLLAFVIRLPELTSRARQTINRLLRMGIYVVVIDYDIGEDFEELAESEQPLFIVSDFRSGGDLIANLLKSELKGDDSSEKAVLALGPKHSSTGSARSKAILWNLMTDGHHDFVIPAILTSFEPDHVCELIIERLEGCDAKKVIVFAGNDSIAECLSLRLPTAKLPLDLTVQIVGYDGIRRRNGSMMLEGKQSCIATVDVKPRQQGILAAEAVIQHALRRGRQKQSLEVLRVEPTLIHLNGFVSSPLVGGSRLAAQRGDTVGEEYRGTRVSPLMEASEAKRSMKDVPGT
jgi:DNA-binding LacI/PurR family transcriptional regulator